MYIFAASFNQKHHFMRIKHLCILTLALGISAVAEAQLKIGFTNLEIVVAYLPEAQQVQNELQIYEKQITQKLETKRNYFDVKYQEYTEKAQSPDANPATLAPLEQELQRLQQELQKSLEKSEQDLARKQNELMQPIMEKIKTELKALADEKGYTYILNSATSDSSIILHGSESDEITKLLLSRLGVEIPEE